jgi:hypothetical protein
MSESVDEPTVRERGLSNEDASPKRRGSACEVPKVSSIMRKHSRTNLYPRSDRHG